MAVVSIDLAFKSYTDIGLALLDYNQGEIRCVFQPISLGGQPNPCVLADYITALCISRTANVLLIDGPQGWKHPDNGLVHSRVCERILNTPAKTGLPESVKPANYGPFVRFSIALFDELVDRGWELFSGTSDYSRSRILIESFPLSAWRSLRIPTLPAKSKAKKEDIERCSGDLQKRFPLAFSGSPTHDEIQAMVSGIAGIAIEKDIKEWVRKEGQSPQMFEGSWREGFIVNPSCCYQ